MGAVHDALVGERLVGSLQRWNYFVHLTFY